MRLVRLAVWTLGLGALVLVGGRLVDRVGRELVKELGRLR